MDSFRDIVARLEVIASIQPGDKLNTKSGTLALHTLLSRLERTLMHRENRSMTVEFCTHVVNDVEKFAKSRCTQELLDRIRDPLKRSIDGLANLRVSYDDDVYTKGKITALIHSIEMLLETIPETKSDDHTVDPPK